MKKIWSFRSKCQETDEKVRQISKKEEYFPRFICTCIQKPIANSENNLSGVCARSMKLLVNYKCSAVCIYCEQLTKKAFLWGIIQTDGDEKELMT